MNVKSKLYEIFTPGRSIALFILVMIGLGFMMLSHEIGEAKYYRITAMPPEIQYQIHDLNHGYSYYTDVYTLGDEGLITSPHYWTFDYRSKQWSYHPVQFRLIGVNATIDELAREYKTIPVKE